MNKKFIIIQMLLGLILTVTYFTFINGNDFNKDIDNETCYVMPDGTIAGKCTNEEIIRLQEEFKKKESTKFLPTGWLGFSELAFEKPTEVISLENNERIRLEAKVISKEINGVKHRMYGYNGQIPGPLLKVKKGSQIKLDFFNNIDLDSTIHWHGVRVSNRNDGVPDVTQKVVKSGEKFFYNLKFPDEGIYWYHSHFREDIEQDLGLYGNIIVYSDNINKSFNGEEILILDDILIDNNNIVGYGKEEANYALMGRFGNVMLVNGETTYNLNVNKGEVVRFYITNVANVRPFKIYFSDAKMKLIGGDIGYFEREEFVDSIIIGPAERYIVDVLFYKEGESSLIHSNPVKNYQLGKIVVKGENKGDNFSGDFNIERENLKVIKDIDKYRKYFNEEPDYQIDLDVSLDGMHLMHMMQMPNNEEGIEWEDNMEGMNAIMTSSDVRWILRDNVSGKENMDIMYKFKVGDKVKIRIFNKENSMHLMQHPIHFHGQRFLVLSLDGKKNENLVWKDTVLVPAGSYVDILLDVSNPGKWMAHCHIPEHMESGMMLMFEVAENE